jgi:broad specificity phosphatase PhoE
MEPINTPLTERGVQEVRTAGRQAQQHGLVFDVIISSPLLRARASANAIAEELGYDVNAIEYLDLLVERDWGSIEGTPGDRLPGKTAWIYRDIDNVKGAETTEEMQQRAIQALQYLRSRPEQRILLVGHGTFGRALRRAVNGEDYTVEYAADFPTNRLPNGEIFRLV